MRLLWHHKHSTDAVLSRVGGGKEGVRGATLLRGYTKSPNRQGAAASGDNQERKCQRKSQSVRGGARRKLYRIVVTLLGLVLPQVPRRPCPLANTHALFNGAVDRQQTAPHSKSIQLKSFFFFLTLKTSKTPLVLWYTPSQAAHQWHCCFLLAVSTDNKQKEKKKENSLENCRKLFIFHFTFPIFIFILEFDFHFDWRKWIISAASRATNET